MKYVITLIVAVFIVNSFTACITNDLSKNNGKIEFETKEFNFGNLEINDNGKYSFKFTNVGNTPVVINQVKTSCGCTVPSWSKKPIKPGKPGEISILYDTSHPGMFNKSITVYFNGKDSPTELIIKGTVAYPKDLEANHNLGSI